MGTAKDAIASAALNESGHAPCTNRSHACGTYGRPLEDHVGDLKRLIDLRGDLPHVSVERQLAIVDELLSFPFGQYMLDRRGANGYWTDYLITHPNTDHRLGHQASRTLGSATEDFLLNRAPVVVAHRDRFRIFQTLTQRLLKPGVVLASVPCGLMRDLLTLDYSSAPDAELYGIDIDPDALQLAKYLADTSGFDNVHLHQMDAWSLPFENKFDVVNSSGLNVYVDDRQEVINLYKSLHKTLKPGGYLVTSVLTRPPAPNHEGDWDLEKFSPDDLLFEKILFQDILNLKWRNFRSVSELEADFKAAGFSHVSVHMDRYRVFPTILAQK